MFLRLGVVLVKQQVIVEDWLVELNRIETRSTTGRHEGLKRCVSLHQYD